MKPWEKDWSASSTAPFDAALAAEGVSGPVAELARSIYQQESASGKNTKTSNAGAVGGMQILPGTFKEVADAGWSINDPIQNARAGIRYAKQMYDRADGDVRLAAAGYYGGPGGLEKARRGVPVSDPRNPNAPDTLQYGEQVAARIPKKKGVVQRAVEAVIPSAEAGELPKKPWEMEWAKEPVKEQPREGSGILPSLAKGVASGFAQIGDTIINRGTKSAADVLAGIDDTMGILPERVMRPKAGITQIVTGQAPMSQAEKENAERARLYQDFRKENRNGAFTTGEILGNIAATYPVGGVLGQVAKAGGAVRLGNALASGGMRTGAEVAPGAMNALADMGIRMAGGAITGGASAGLVDPASADTGALIGGVAPPFMRLLGAVGSGVGRAIRGPEVPQGIRAAAEAARDAGYVIPPTQVKPTLVNRLLEGIAGKTSTAQNASARNQEVTNRLAQKAIGVTEDLSPELLASVRSRANQAYAELGNFGIVTTDDAFRKAVAQAGQQGEKIAKDFPELVNKPADDLLASFAGKQAFDSQSAIEAIKRLREGQRTALGSLSATAEQKAYGRMQGKLADALEGVIERNLKASGQEGLLETFRNARQTLAKVYDIEKALNPATGSVNAQKMGSLLSKGRLSGELKQIGEFGQAFRTAAQPIERMGSLPQISPLDYAFAVGMGGASYATDDPRFLLAATLRPGMRSLALSPVVQNRLLQAAMPAISANASNLLLSPVYRAGPLLATDR